MAAIRAELHSILAEDHPQTVRGVFYQATVRGAVPKTDDSKGYGTVQRLLVEMRRSGEIPYGWIADSTRWMRKADSYSSAEQALRNTASTYRRALWDSSDTVVEIWVEKEALAGVLAEVTERWDVALMVCRGYPSLSFLHSAAETIAARPQRTTVVYLGDRDPSGVDIDRAVVQGIGESLMVNPLRTADPLAFAMFGQGDDPVQAFHSYASFERIAVTEEQIAAWGLPSRPTKKKDSRSKGFEGESVELDAIPSHQLRELTEASIERHVDRRQLEVLRTAEAEERRLLEQVAATFNGDAP